MVKDRLAAYFHWRDQQSLVQALCIMLDHKLKPREFSEFCKKEGKLDSAKELALLYQKLTSLGVLEMGDIKAQVTDYFLTKT